MIDNPSFEEGDSTWGNWKECAGDEQKYVPKIQTLRIKTNCPFCNGELVLRYTSRKVELEDAIEKRVDVYPWSFSPREIMWLSKYDRKPLWFRLYLGIKGALKERG